jgi:hypothetical protein
MAAATAGAGVSPLWSSCNEPPFFAGLSFAAHKLI